VELRAMATEKLGIAIENGPFIVDFPVKNGDFT